VAQKALAGLLDRLRPTPAGAAAKAGEPGESLACEFLRRNGYQIVTRNFRCRSGEVDVIARQGDTTVFVEVKDRGSASHGEGHEAVTFAKRRRIIRAAQLYAASRGLSESPLRFDVISIDRGEGEKRRVRHDAGAFDVEGG
jgi:putative endonuclease